MFLKTKHEVLKIRMLLDSNMKIGRKKPITHRANSWNYNSRN